MTSFSKKSWHLKLWRLNYIDAADYKYGTVNKTNVPENLCDYFWQLVWVVITFPILMFTYLIPPKYHISDMKLIASRAVIAILYNLCAALLIVVGTSILYDSEPETLLHYIYGFFVGLLVVGGIGLFATGLVIGGTKIAKYFVDKRKEKRKYKSDNQTQTNLLFSYLNARKNKYCPKIEWHD